MLLDEKESKIIIPGPIGSLEAILNRGHEDALLSSINGLAIICHPHPQHGGTMDNKVVTTLMRTYRDLGIHVLRFNFRGVGKSEGAFDNAVGELDDLLTIISWANSHLTNSPVMLGGFSFGSSIAARASYQMENLRHLTLVAPPVERYDYDRDGVFQVPACVIQGDQDELVIAQGVYDWVAQLHSPVELIRYPQAGHFFHGFLSSLKTDLTEMLVRQIIR